MKKNKTGLFGQQVYALCARIPKGRVSSYKLIAQAMKTKAYRAVGQALRHNPYAPQVPCHRVVGSSGELTGFNGQRKGEKVEQKKKLLEKEGIIVKDGRVVDFEKKVFTFSAPPSQTPKKSGGA